MLRNVMMPHNQESINPRLQKNGLHELVMKKLHACQRIVHACGACMS